MENSYKTEKKTEEKRCTLCEHCLIYGWHAVKCVCDIDKREMFGYIGKNEYRENAKNCENFSPVKWWVELYKTENWI